MTDELTSRELEILAFERQWWRYGGAKDVVVRERLGIGSSQFYRWLNALIDRPGALRADPLLVKRLRRQRSARRRQRAATRVADGGLTRSSG